MADCARFVDLLKNDPDRLTKRPLFIAGRSGRKDDAGQIELTEQLKQKDEIISQLKDALDSKGKLICKDSAYYIVDKNDKITDGPFCTKCFDVDHLKCRLVACDKEPQVICTNCKVQFVSKPVFDYLRPDVEEGRKKLIKTMRNQRRSKPQF